MIRRDSWTQKCPQCGIECDVHWANLDMVERYGDETLAVERYQPKPIYKAAPELLEALKAVKALAPPGATHIHKVVDSAIAKTKGK